MFHYFATLKYVGNTKDWNSANEIAAGTLDQAQPHLVDGYRKKFGLPGKGVALAAQTLHCHAQILGGDVEVLEESEDKAEYKISCFFGNALQSGKFDDVQISRGMCDQGCKKLTKDIADSLVGESEVKRITWMGEGAETCHYTICKVE